MEDTILQPNALDKAPKRSKFLIFFIFSVVIIITIFGGWRFLNSRTQKSTSPAVTPNPTEYQLPTESPSKSETPEATKTAKPTASPTSKPILTPTPEPTINPVDKQSGLDRSKLTIEVQNGSGVVGVAKKVADALKNLGYVISTTGNADNYDYKDVTIQVKSAMTKYLALLKKDLGSSYTVGTSSADLTATSSSDALVIVGK